LRVRGIKLPEVFLSLLFFLIIISVWVIIPAGAKVDQVLVKVNEELILLSDLEREMALLSPLEKEPYQGEEGEKKLRQDTLEKLIQDRLFLQAAKKEKEIQVEEAEAELILSEKKKGFGSEEEYKKALEVANLTPEKYRLLIQEQLYIWKFRQKKLREKFPVVMVNVTEEEIKKFYQEIPILPPRVNLRHLLLRVSSPEDEDRVKKQMKELKLRMQKGEDFSQLVKTYSEDLATREKGGALGWWEMGSFQPEYQEMEKAAFSLKPGETAIVKTPMGYHLILVEQRQETSRLPYEEIKDKIREELLMRKKLDKLITDQQAQDYFGQMQSQRNWKDFSSAKYQVKYELLVRKTLDQWITNEEARNYYEQHRSDFQGKIFEEVVYPIKEGLLVKKVDNEVLDQLRRQAKIIYYVKY